MFVRIVIGCLLPIYALFPLVMFFGALGAWSAVKENSLHIPMAIALTGAFLGSLICMGLLVYMVATGYGL